MVGPGLGLDVVAGGDIVLEGAVTLGPDDVSDGTVVLLAGLSSALQPASRDKVEVNVVRTLSGRKVVPRGFMRAPRECLGAARLGAVAKSKLAARE
jgi:hypothetical protein